MNIQERMKYVRLLEKVHRNKSYARQVGLEDRSTFQRDLSLDSNYHSKTERGAKDGIQCK